MEADCGRQLLCQPKVQEDELQLPPHCLCCNPCGQLPPIPPSDHDVPRVQIPVQCLACQALPKLSLPPSTYKKYAELVNLLKGISISSCGLPIDLQCQVSSLGTEDMPARFVALQQRTKHLMCESFITFRGEIQKSRISPGARSGLTCEQSCLSGASSDMYPRLAQPPGC